MESTSFIEDKHAKTIDRCFTDAVVKGGGGLLTGSVISLLFFKRRTWPILLATGFGIGVAYRTCEKELNSIR